MMYSSLICDGSKEIPVFLKFRDFSNNNICVLNRDLENIFYGRKKWENVILKVFNIASYYTFDSNLKTYTIPEGKLFLEEGFIAIKVEDFFEILFLKTDKHTYISKNIKSYNTVWKNLGKKITEYLEGDEDVVLTKDCGKNAFLSFEKPKFKSLVERQEYCEKLLQEVLTH